MTHHFPLVFFYHTPRWESGLSGTFSCIRLPLPHFLAPHFPSGGLYFVRRAFFLEGFLHFGCYTPPFSFFVQQSPIQVVVDLFFLILQPLGVLLFHGHFFCSCLLSRILHAWAGQLPRRMLWEHGSLRTARIFFFLNPHSFFFLCFFPPPSDSHLRRRSARCAFFCLRHELFDLFFFEFPFWGDFAFRSVWWSVLMMVCNIFLSVPRACLILSPSDWIQGLSLFPMWGWYSPWPPISIFSPVP